MNNFFTDPKSAYTCTKEHTAAAERERLIGLQAFCRLTLVPKEHTAAAEREPVECA